MSYVTHAEFILSLDPKDASELSDDASGGAPAEETILPILADATGVCDSYIGTRYTVPLTSPDGAVKSACTRIAVYFLHLRRSWTVSDTVKDAYDDAIAWLKDVAKGIAVLPIPPAAESSRASGYFGAETRIFQGVSHDNTTDKFNGF